MPTIPEVLMMSVAFWLLVYLGWLFYSPAYRKQQADGWKRSIQPHPQNYVFYAMMVIIGGIWSTELFQPDYQFQVRDLIPVLAGIGGIVGLTMTLRRRFQR